MTTLCFCETVELLPADRTVTGYRVSGPDGLERLAFISSAKVLGLSGSCSVCGNRGCARRCGNGCCRLREEARGRERRRDPLTAPAGGADASRSERELLARAELLGELTVNLSDSLNPRRTVLRLFDLITLRIADWAVVALVDGAGGLVLHGGHDQTFTTVLPRVLVDGTGLDRVLRSGQVELLHVAVELDSSDGLDTMVPTRG